MASSRPRQMRDDRIPSYRARHRRAPSEAFARRRRLQRLDQRTKPAIPLLGYRHLFVADHLNSLP